MQKYIINKFTRVSAPFNSYTLDQRSGKYTSRTQTAHLYDFLCNGEFKITSVIKKYRDHLPNDEVFSIGDQVILGDGVYRQIQDITKFEIKNKEVILHLTKRGYEDRIADNTILLQNANKYNPEMAKEVKTNAGIMTNDEKSTDKFHQLRKSIESSYTRPIRLANFNKKRKEKSVKEFLIRFFTELNDSKETIYVDDKTVQTEVGKRRSLGDIYMICKYYFPNTTLETVIYALYVELPAHFNNNGFGFRTSYCYTINKRVWYYMPRTNSLVADRDQIDEYRHDYNYYLNKVTE